MGNRNNNKCQIRAIKQTNKKIKTKKKYKTIMRTKIWMKKEMRKQKMNSKMIKIKD